MSRRIYQFNKERKHVEKFNQFKSKDVKEQIKKNRSGTTYAR